MSSLNYDWAMVKSNLPLIVRKVQSQADLVEFVKLPWRVYAGDPFWVPPLFSERLAFQDPKHNPFFEHAEVERFLALRGDETVGTIAAFTNHRHNKFHNENIAFFGFFEVLEDEEAAVALLDAAQQWARAKGHTALRGPAQFSTNEECGLLIDGFDDAPRVLMTYNPRRYQEYVENNGFSKVMDLLAYRFGSDTKSVDDLVPKKLQRVARQVSKRADVRLRPLNMRNFQAEIENIKRVYNRSWERNWGFVPMSDREMEKLARDLKLLLDPELILIAEVAGETVGFGLSLPDLNEPLLKVHPRPGKPEWLTSILYLWHLKVFRKPKWLRVVALGVVPEHRGKGIDALIYYETTRVGLRKGYRQAELSWILASNDMMNRIIRMVGGKVYKTYALYEKSL